MRVRAALARYKSELADAKSQVTSSARDVEVLPPSAHLPYAVLSIFLEVYCIPTGCKGDIGCIGETQSPNTRVSVQHCHHCMQRAQQLEVLHHQAFGLATLLSAVPQEAKELLKKAEYNRETKNAEAKVVSGAARTKRTELNDLERLLARRAVSHVAVIKHLYMHALPRAD